MKKIYVLFIIVISMLTAHAQEVLQEEIPDDVIEEVEDEERAAPDQLPWRDSINTNIKAYNATPTPAGILKVIQLLRTGYARPDKQSVTEADSLLHYIDSVIKISDSTKVKLKEFTTQKPSPQADNGGKEKQDKKGECDELAKVNAVTITKTPDADYEVSFVDRDDNPLAGFIIRQPNEALFYDKVEKELADLCGDKSPNEVDDGKKKGIIDYLKKRDLYQHMLEAALLVNDDDVYAGKLTVFKHLDVGVCKGSAKCNLKAANAKRGESSNVTRDTTSKEIDHKQEKEVDRNVSFAVYSTAQPGQASNTLKRTPPVQPTEEASFTVHNIQIQFQDGFIENIKIRGKIPTSNRLLKFENRFPIPFSTRRDFRRLFSTALFERTIYESASKNKEAISGLVMNLGHLIEFDQNLEIDTKDYSPVNQVWEADLKEAETVVNLLKERTSKILELKVFTDLKGIENDNPNGLVQLELIKRLNFLNHRREIFNNFGNVGLLNSITPSFTMSKIENNNKRLPVSYMGSQQSDSSLPNTYASTLQLLQHQAFRIGGELGLATLDIPGIKSVLNVKTGWFFGRTLTADTMRVMIDSATFEPVKDNNILESGVNSFQFIPEVSLQVFPDKRYGVSFAYRAINYRIMSRTLKQVTDSLDYANYMISINGDRAKINDYPFRRWLASAEVYAFFRPSPYNQLFFRYRFNYDMSQVKVNFHQVQLGFATYLTHTSKGKKEQQRTANE